MLVVVDCLGVDISILSTTCADGISFVSRGGDTGWGRGCVEHWTCSC